MWTILKFNKLVKHLLEVAKIGYGYNRKEIVDIASDYTVTLGKRTVEKPLTLNWIEISTRNNMGRCVVGRNALFVDNEN
jgi:hypothetical protein